MGPFRCLDPGQGAVEAVNKGASKSMHEMPVTELRRTTEGDGSMGHFLTPDDETPAHPFGKTLAA